jgi:hypothetical protein
MWVINIHHWLDETKSAPAVPRLKRKANKPGEIITYATSKIAGIPKMMETKELEENLQV